MNATRKKGMCWIGHLIILKCLNDVTYQVRMNKKAVHHHLLKLFEGRDLPCWQKALKKVKEIS